ncbi:MAG: HAD family hydrolase [Acidimicrobiaceae bacterium]|nr:HAD family hydrolase [Acidimicrobiaceae bacterium]OUW33729.1 MAG: HAD family hydrolase [Actinobacteria bacterium TMED172]HBV24511.1 HAD family hydrolase [Acidimicrobiaceae bacterium]HCK74563.1 HAD family hydrolase [Acidimicrobiaceae bacterium]
MIDVVLFDFGGVITASPFEAFAAYEQELGIPTGSIRKINSTNPDGNAWAKMERNEISLEDFCSLFEEEAAALGLVLSGNRVLGCLSGAIRPQMVRALEVLKERVSIGCITNNMKSGHGSGMSRTPEQAEKIAEIMTMFEVVIESAKVGLRKPDPRIYQMACDELQVAAERCVYLDDLGINCKPAAALGMRAIKVVDPDEALSDLEKIVGFELR